MKTLIAALGIVLLLSSTSFAGWYVGPTVYQAYYPMAPVYGYPAPVVAAPAPYVAYMPVATPVVTYYNAPVVAPVPVIVGRPAVVRTKVYYPGQPVRNAVKAVVP
jgi:hypothetical protein